MRRDKDNMKMCPMMQMMSHKNTMCPMMNQQMMQHSMMCPMMYDYYGMNTPMMQSPMGMQGQYMGMCPMMHDMMKSCPMMSGQSGAMNDMKMRTVDASDIED